MSLLGGAQIFFFAAAVACVAAAFLTARARRVHSAPDPQRPWWLGQPSPVKPTVGAGWVLFVLLNVAYGALQPVLACGIFIRAYVLRAVCLRRRG